ncbi:galactokinase [Gordonia soli]|uniref:Galactokinase n=1 Tax=Gordonia soli NBRC 108243 TaxID=1223545 RepID=M0QRE5_9ACTN|nr:galactokinase [Gordonia soli]GAC70077.1 galactokinase [Gordonia soli NBRC 108243]
MTGTAIRAYAPGRVNLIGEHTDYNLGFALPIALPMGTTVDYRPADPGVDDDRLVATSTAEPDTCVIDRDTRPGDVGGWGAYVAGCAWALREAGHRIRGGTLHVDSTVPVGAGLSSSAALECAVLLALTADARPDRHEIARLARRAENDYVGAPTGLLDQLSSLYGDVDTALLIDFRSLAVAPIPCELDHQVRLLVIDSRSAHQHVAGEYAERKASCERAAAELGVDSLREASSDAWESLPQGPIRSRARHILTENARVLDAAGALRDRDFTALGVAMDASHRSMRDDFEISTPQIDRIVDAAKDLGALGARMTGGGFGGSVVVFADAASASAITDRLPDTIVDAGFTRPQVREIRPGRGATVGSAPTVDSGDVEQHN